MINNLKECLNNSNLKQSSIIEYLNAFNKWKECFKLENEIIPIPSEESYKIFAQYLYSNYCYTYLTFQRIMFSIIGIFKRYSIYIKDTKYNISNIHYLVDILINSYFNSNKVDKNKIKPNSSKTYSNLNLDIITKKDIIYDFFEDNIKTDRFYIFISLLRYTGLRRSDILESKINNLAITGDKIHINLIIKKTNKEYNSIITNKELSIDISNYINKLNLRDNNYLLPRISRNCKVVNSNNICLVNTMYKMYYDLLDYLYFTNQININKDKYTLVSFRKSLAQKLYNSNESISNILNAFKWNSNSCSSYIEHKYEKK